MKDKNIFLGKQRGNALFLILIAVALFAALSYAVTRSGRSRSTIDRETAMLKASQITQYPATLDTAITRMIITGTTADEIHFGQTGNGLDDEGNVFDSDGGGITPSDPPNGIGPAQGDWPAQGTLVDGTWGFKDVTDAANGYYVYDIGINTDVSGREAIAFLHDIKVGVCEQINKGLGVAYDPIPDQATAVDYTTNTGTGDAGPAASGGSANTFGAIADEPFACFQNGATAVYDYYHVLIEQ
jgi:hypothetical protein